MRRDTKMKKTKHEKPEQHTIGVRFDTAVVQEIDEAVEEERKKSPGLLMTRGSLIRMWVMARLRARRRSVKET